MVCDAAVKNLPLRARVGGEAADALLSLRMPKTASPTPYAIVVNESREYAVWPSERPLPEGWRHSGKAGPREELLAHLRASFAPTVELTPPVRK